MTNPIARQEGLVVQEVADEVLIYDLRENKAFCLNPSAAAVWRLCDGTKTVRDIARGMGSSGVQDDVVWLALRQMEDSGLLAEHVERPFPGRSRRQLIKAIGSASAIALPLVATLVVPATGSLSCDGCVGPADCVTMVGCPSTTNCNALGMCAPTNPVPRAT